MDRLLADDLCDMSPDPSGSRVAPDVDLVARVEDLRPHLVYVMQTRLLRTFRFERGRQKDTKTQQVN